MSLAIEVFSDSEWASRVAGAFAAILEEEPGARLCLPTGDTVTPLYCEIAQVADLSQATVFLLDEFGGLPPGDPARCESMIHSDLIARLDQPPEVRLPDVDAADPEAEARRYEEAVRDGGIDLALLGLGANGHVGMNEPGSGADSLTRVVSLAESTAEHAVDAYDASRPPRWGITLGMKPLLEAKEVWLLVTGEHKAEILDRVVSAPVGPEVPATFLRRHPRATVMADQSAASRL